MNTGLIHVYIGDGKGKTSASLGLALRCYGAGMKVLVLQFLKTWDSGEVDAVKHINDENFKLLRFESEHDLVFDDATELDLQYLNKDIKKAYDFALQSVQSGEWDLVVLDEILWAHYFEFISEDALLELLKHKCHSTELVLTGRKAPDSVLGCADYITRMQAIRHPYEKGIDARKGIEY